MVKKGVYIIIMYLVLTMFLPFSTVKAAQGTMYRISGDNRYDTACRVATTNWTKSENVILVSGEGYADAISASVLSKKLDAPIIFTTPNELSSEAKKALYLLKPKNIYVIGGDASISQSIRNNLKISYNLIELSGVNRYETNIMVAKELVSLGVSPANIMVVGGEGFSDALSVAPVAASKEQILLLANNDLNSMQPIIHFIKNNKSVITVVGTKNIINDAIYNAIGANTRIDGGSDRFETNLNVLNAFKNDLHFDKVYIANASPMVPDNMYADALVAATVAAKYLAPLVLVDKDPSTRLLDLNATDNAINFIKNNVESTFDLELIGGTKVISQGTENAIDEYIIGFV
ncbi:cell wall-binding repeat-containing protein [Clostridium autoethanogenum]|uniref:Cell wall-binding repeat-containing protein n=1 Tax=Clostridium autoethanogenum TaxID=84023 RepID=A0A3M0TA71_9CLOT|nr:cell wall-binding repeat-containing protein [Clostridium autoethanogenum]RMD04048.1 cell wall-binding repeat-containing protein [Clostridium autoethanogenum]